jgi:hypothetical protein
MWPYWLLFLVPAFLAVNQPVRPWAMGVPKGVLDLRSGWIALCGLTVIVGLRDQVGGDWGNYLAQSANVAYDSFAQAVARSEPAYWLVMWSAAATTWGVYLANLIFAFIFSLGLMIFCRAQPRPWLALAVAVPYLVIVLGMGYTRQGVALGLAMIGLVSLGRGNTIGFVTCIALGGLFHKSAVLLIPLGMLATPRKKVWTALWVGVAGYVLYAVVLRDTVDALTINYIDAGYESEGAFVRVMMNVLPAVFLLVFRKRFHWERPERNLWTTVALLALGSVLWLALSPSSTAVDRVALYLIPLQLYVFSRIPDLMTNDGRRKRVWLITVLAYYCAVQFVWLVFAVNSRFWLPYRFFPLD